jgi:hypothetical protein
MLGNMSSNLLSEWMAYYNLEPFGNELLDVHFARLTAVQVSTKKKPVTLDKFRLWKKIANITDKFDPQRFYEDLKTAFGLKKSQD